MDSKFFMATLGLSCVAVGYLLPEYSIAASSISRENIHNINTIVSIVIILEFLILFFLPFKLSLITNRTFVVLYVLTIMLCCNLFVQPIQDTFIGSDSETDFIARYHQSLSAYLENAIFSKNSNDITYVNNGLKRLRAMVIYVGALFLSLSFFLKKDAISKNQLLEKGMDSQTNIAYQR